jgi:cytosine/adenosine deaminase-related metal-dependent hydrolase
MPQTTTDAGKSCLTFPPLFVCSHISESLDQVEFTQQLHPRCSSDAQVYDQAGLLTIIPCSLHALQP